MSLADFPAAPLAFVGLGLCLQAACAQQPPSAPPPAPDPRPLQGRWESETGSGTISMTIEGDSLYFYERPDHQFDTTFTLVPGTDPPELHATILDSPRTTDNAGELVIAIYELEDGVLAVCRLSRRARSPR